MLCVLFLLLAFIKVAAAVNCRSCDHVATPGECDTWTTCGQGEVCYTREFKEVDGAQAFKLGCEAQMLCTLYLDAINVDSGSTPSAAANEGLCYNCCFDNDCNKDLCHDKVPTTTPAPRPKVCPEFYMQILEHCYFLGLWETSWLEARHYCKKTRYSDLASINNKRENDYVNINLIKLGAPLSGYWLGSFYSSASGEWEWVDRTPLTYTIWQKNYPPKTLAHTLDYYTMQPKPVNGKASSWKTDTSDKRHGFLCEVPPS